MKIVKKIAVIDDLIFTFMINYPGHFNENIVILNFINRFHKY